MALTRCLRCLGIGPNLEVTGSGGFDVSHETQSNIAKLAMELSDDDEMIEFSHKNSKPTFQPLKWNERGAPPPPLKMTKANSTGSVLISGKIFRENHIFIFRKGEKET